VEFDDIVGFPVPKAATIVVYGFIRMCAFSAFQKRTAYAVRVQQWVKYPTRSSEGIYSLKVNTLCEEESRTD